MKLVATALVGWLLRRHGLIATPQFFRLGKKSGL